VKTVFVDTSGFYAVLDGTDPFHPTAKNLFERAEANSRVTSRQSTIDGEVTV
jgi:predicted nucleic acid-binding protein